MRKIIFILLIILLAIGVFGCSKASGGLKEDDFDVYENGKLFLDLSEEEQVIFNLNTDDEMGMQKEYDGHIFSTRRGIKIGSSLNDFKKAYGDVAAAIIIADNKEEISVNEFFSGDRERYRVNYHIMIINGTIYDALTDDKEIMDELGVDTKEWLDIKRGKSKDYKIEEYWMQVFFENNIITNLRLSYKSS